MININVHNLNDLMFFSSVVEHGGFSAAERALGVSKSRLSRRLSELEATLGVRLLQRSTRKLALTEAGELFYQHCRAMMDEARNAIETVTQLGASPRGTVRVSCPATLSQGVISRVIAEFMQKYPDVRVLFTITNRVVDLYDDAIDIALRVRSDPPASANIILRPLWRTEQLLVGAPSLAGKLDGSTQPADLSAFATLDTPSSDGRHVYRLQGPQGRVHEHEHEPRLVTADLTMIREAAIARLGIAALPEMVYRSAMREGRLVRVLPDWSLPPPHLYAAFLSRQGMSPAVRAFVDFLVERLPHEAGGEL
jgi:DNA-binding transcriptional LysR family regulator